MIIQRVLKGLLLVAGIFIFCSLCLIYKTVNSDPGYDISKNEISHNKHFIERFSISVYYRSPLEEDFFSIIGKKKARYCCEFKNESNLTSKVIFKDSTDCYTWFRCDINSEFRTVDSLKNLSLEDKLKVIRNRNKGEAAGKKSFNKMPFKFTKNEVYILSGLKKSPGEYYIYFDESNKLIADYHERGPW